MNAITNWFMDFWQSNKVMIQAVLFVLFLAAFIEFAQWFDPWIKKQVKRKWEQWTEKKGQKK